LHNKPSSLHALAPICRNPSRGPLLRCPLLLPWPRRHHDRAIRDR
jgi:hypothetical protein